MGNYILAHDLGTSGDKATLFSAEGKLIGSCVSSYDTNYFNDNWAEQDAEDWWKAVASSTKELIETYNIPAEEIRAVSFSGQMMGCLCVDKKGNPLRKSIIWADQRAVEQSKRIEEHISQWDFYNIVGHRNTPSYGIQKLMWIKDHEPEVYANTHKILNAKDYIVFKLTGKFFTEYSDGNSMACLDINRLCWSEELISYAGVDGDKLPELKPSTHVAGGVTQEAAAMTGLAEGTPVVLGAGDGVTANIGAGSIAPGKTYCSMGTSAWVTTTAEKPIFDEKMRIVNWAHGIEGLYAPNGTMQTAGGAYSWVKETLGALEAREAKEQGVSPYELMNESIARSPVGANGVIFLPYLLGERAPRWNPNAKGCFVGLKQETTRGDMMRSVLEGVTMNLSVILEILRSKMEITEIVAIGGGAKGRVWRQIMADIFDAKILVPTLLEEAGSMGAAIIGGVGAGVFKDFTVVDRFLEIDSTQMPHPQSVESYGPYKEVFNDSYFALTEVFEKLSRI